jgi:glycerophosphoryl diester phosphodiesterase
MVMMMKPSSATAASQLLLVLVLLVTLCSYQSEAVRAGDSSYDGPWRKTLDGVDSCWSSPVSTCNRVMTTSHGGDWNLKYPYDSLPAFENAFTNGADSVKGDFRVCGDNVGMVMHSSPIEFYESLACRGQYVEKMSVSECEACQMALTNITFISIPTLLAWAENNVNVMLCVKESSDLPRAISTLVENKAAHRTFLEVHLGDYLALETNNVPNWSDVYYVVQVNSADEIQTLLSASPALLSRAILFEFHHWTEWPTPETLKDDITTVQAQGRRTFAATKDTAIGATVKNHLDLYNMGFDVAFTYNLANAVEARIQINTERGLTPP